MNEETIIKKVSITKSRTFAVSGKEIVQIFEMAANEDAEGDNIFIIEQTADGAHVRLISDDPRKIALYQEAIRIEES